MTGASHTILGVSYSLVLASLTNVSPQAQPTRLIGFIAVAGIMALLPDADAAESTFWHIFKLTWSDWRRMAPWNARHRSAIEALFGVLAWLIWTPFVALAQLLRGRSNTARCTPSGYRWPLGYSRAC